VTVHVDGVEEKKEVSAQMVTVESVIEGFWFVEI